MSDYQQLPGDLPVPQDDGAFYPISPPGQHAAEVLEWLRGHAAVGT